MEQQKVDMFLMANGDRFPEEDMPEVRADLLHADEGKWSTLSLIQFKNPVVALIISLFLGHLGIDRFYVGNIGLGILKLLTCGGCGLWTVIDWFIIMRAAKKQNYEKLQGFLY